MRSTFRLFMGAILFTAAAGFVRAQEPSTPPPAPAPDVAQPVAELPQIPVAEPIPPVVEPAVAAEPIAPAVEPAAAAPVEVPAAAKQVVTSTKRVTKKTVVKPVEKPMEAPAVQLSESAKPAAAAASAPTVDTTGNAPPPNAPAVAAPAVSVAPPPASRAAVVESHAEEAVAPKKLGAGSWILFGVALLAMAGIAVKFLRRTVATPTSIVDFTTIHPEPKPALVTRP